MDKERSLIMEALVRGILVGGSVGVLGGIFFMDMRRGFTLGIIAGFFAAATRLALTSKRGGKKKDR